MRGETTVSFSFSRGRPMHWLRRVRIVLHDSLGDLDGYSGQSAVVWKSDCLLQYKPVLPTHRTLTASQRRWNVRPCISPVCNVSIRNPQPERHHTLESPCDGRRSCTVRQSPLHSGLFFGRISSLIQASLSRVDGWWGHYRKQGMD